MQWGLSVDSAALVRDTIYRSTIFLDRQQWNDWLAHCDDQFQYAIRAWSPEINKDVTYLALDHNGLASMVKLLPKHNTDHSPLTRHTSVYTVDVDEAAHSAKAVSSVVVYQNSLGWHQFACRCRRNSLISDWKIPRHVQACGR